MKPLVIFGAGDIAELAHFYFTNDSEREVVAFAVDPGYREADRFAGLPVIESDILVDRYPPDRFDAFVAMSYAKMNEARASKVAMLQRLGYALPSYVSSHCTNLSSEVGENCFILEDNTIQPFVRIGHNVTLWSGNHIGHHSVIEDNCFLTSHVVVAGGVRIGRNSFVGINATLRDHITLAPETLVAAGAIVVKDTRQGQVLRGHAATVMDAVSTELKI